MKYSVLTYIMGDYEKLHEIKEKSENAEYICVTDNPNLTSDTWEIYYDSTLTGSSFAKVLMVRYQPFKYIHTDTVIRVDGSVGINKPLDAIIDKMEKEDYKALYLLHPTRNTMYDEYAAWVAIRGYDVNQANNNLLYFNTHNYDVKKYKGLVQLNFSVQKDCKMNRNANEYTLALCHYLSLTDDVDRLDQTINSFVLMKYFPAMRFGFFDERIVHGKLMTWFAHNSDIPLNFDSSMLIKPYWNNERVMTLREIDL